MTETSSLPKIGAPASRALNAAGYHSIRDLDGVSRTALLALHGVGPRAIRILDEEMRESAFSLAD